MTSQTLAPLEVACQGQPLGHLIGAAPDVWLFRPAEQAGTRLPAWSPLSQANGTAVNRRPWFRHLLPDVPTCARLARRLGLTPGHDYALLGIAGRDCRGGLRLSQAGTAPRAVAEQPSVLDAAALAGLARALPAGDFETLPAGLDLLLPGDPGQFFCAYADGRIVLAEDRPWLARLGRPGLDEAVENEALIRRIAQGLGLPGAEAQLLWLPTPLLAARRLDRDDAGAPCHLEDFGQLAGRHPEQAFEREGGLAVCDCAQLIRRYSAAPALDLRMLLGWLVFAFLAGLGGAHASTLALRDTARGPRLAIWDGWLSTHVYPSRSERLAMHLGREDRPDWIRPARWRETAEELGVGSRYLLELVHDLATRLPALAREATRTLALDGRALRVLPRVLTLIDQRARQTLIALAAETV
ncbi:MAG: HipA domain-containing protein [Gammaproteobacteria bacterium]